MLSGKQYWHDRINELAQLQDDIDRICVDHQIPYPDNFIDWIKDKIKEYGDLQDAE